MKKYLLITVLLFLIISSWNFSIAQSNDTTFKANLFESKKNTVRVLFHTDDAKYMSGLFTITVDKISYTDSSQNAMDFYEVKVVDLDNNDDYKEIAVCTYFNENTEYQLYRFDGKKIISLSTVTSMDVPIFLGDGTVKSKGWMGFWSYDYYFILNESKMKYEPVFKDEYPVKFYEGFDQDIKVIESFNTYKERNVKSDIVTKFKPGDKIKLIKAYTKVKCDVEYTEMCFWYLIQDKDGKKGWLQLKDFSDKVEGLPWAG